MSETQVNRKKKVGIAILIILALLSLSTYFVFQFVNARTIDKNLELGQKYYDEGKYEEAIIAYETVLDIDPKNVEARIGLAKSYVALERVDKADKLLLKGIEIVNDEPRLYLELADSYLAHNRVVDAIHLLDKGIKATDDKSIKAKYAKIDQQLELVVDQTILQFKQKANLKLIYHGTSEKKTEANNKQLNDQKEKSTGQEEKKAVKKEQHHADFSSKEASVTKIPKEEKVGKKSANNKESKEEVKEDSAIGVNANWRLESKKIGELKKSEGDVNEFTASKKKEGSETIIAEVGSISKTANVNVREHVLTSLKVTMSKEDILVGDKVKLTVTGLDAQGKKMEAHPYWEVLKGADKLKSNQGAKNSITVSKVGTIKLRIWEEDVETNVTINVQENEVTLTKVAVGKGSIIANPNEKKIKKNEAVTLTAKPAKGWKFVRWEGDVKSKDETISVNMNSDKTVRAVFKEIKTYALFTSIEGSGAITTSPAKEKYEENDVVTLEAIPTDGWVFDHWSGDITSKNNKEKIQLDESKTVRAIFVSEEKLYGLSTDVKGEGTITRDVDEPKYKEGTVVMLTAKPKKGFVFKGWSGVVSSDSPTVRVKLDRSKSATATFEKKVTAMPVVAKPQDPEEPKEEPKEETYRLAITKKGEGTISTSPSKEKYEKGEVVTLKAKAKEGFTFSGWKGDITSEKASVQVTMDQDHALTAVFVKKEASIESYSLNVSKQGEGTISTSPSKEKYEKGEVVTLKAKAKEGFTFSGWKGDVTSEESSITVTMDQDRTLTAVFVKKETPVESYKLSVSKQGEGTVSQTPSSEKYESGTVVTLTAQPKEGWLFARWEGSTASQSNPVSVTMDANKDVTAVFVQAHQITGTVKNARTGVAVKGASVTVRLGANNQTGTIIKQSTTNANGQYTLPSLKPGTYTLEVKADNYQVKYDVVDATENAITTQDESIMPVETEDLTKFTAVLSWSDEPKDLDSHLTGPTADGQNRFHVSYQNKLYSENGEKYASLDVDATNGRGPETVTTFKEVDGVYRYYVYNYSGSPSLTQSQAKVELYREGRLIRTFSVPTSGEGRYWHVFEIQNGQLRVLNQLAGNPLN